MSKESYEKFMFNSKREGLIGDVAVSQAEVLFILKEPHDKDNKDKFWLKNDIYSNRKENNRYYSLFCILADKLINGDESSHDKLGKCAFMNLYPFSGGATASEEYKSLKKEVIFERLMSCLEAIKPKKIVCCLDVYDKVVKCFTVEEKSDGFKYNNRPQPFKKCRVIMGNEKIDVFEFYHPSAWGKKFTSDNTKL